MAEGPVDLPEDGEPDVGKVRNSIRRRERGADLVRGCSACAGLSYQHSKGCLRFRQNVNEDPAFAARVGLTPEQ
eukprot:6370724-Amphidinium_carterae.1